MTTTYKLLLLDNTLCPQVGDVRHHGKPTPLAQKLHLIFEQRSTKFIFTENNTIVVFSCEPLERAYLLKACSVHLGSEECNAIDQSVSVDDMEALTLKYEYTP